MRGRQQPPGPWRRHLRWVLPLVAAPASFLALVQVTNLLTARGDEGDPSLPLALLTLVAALAALGVPLVFLLVALINGLRTLSQWRRRRRHAHGRYTAAERAAHAHRASAAAAWASARALRETLVRREVPAGIAVWDVVPQPGEVFFFDTTAEYARYYGQDVAYTQSGGFYAGRPLFVVAAVAASAIGNAARRSAAVAAAQEQWRERQQVRLLVSNQRLVCNVAGRWLSFFYSGMSAFYPDVVNYSLVCQFESTSPLSLRGLDVPAAALITALMTHGPAAIEQHPGLAALGTRPGPAQRSGDPEPDALSG